MWLCPDRLCCIEASANTWLLQTIARDAWNFDGYVTADVSGSIDAFVRYLIAKVTERDIRMQLLTSLVR